MNNLFKLLDNFTKLAAEIKIPERLLKEATDYTVGCYSTIMSEMLESKIENLKRRNKMYNYILELIEKLNKIYNYIQDLSYDEDKLDELMSYLSKNINVPEFLFEIDEDGFYGIINPAKFYASIYSDNTDDEYYIFINFDANIKKEDKTERIRSHIVKDNINREEVINILIEQKDNLVRLIEALDDFKYSYKVEDNEGIKRLSLINAEFIKLSKLLGDDDVYNAKLLKINSSEIPYINLKDNKTFEFKLRFLYNENMAKSISETNFAGLWEEIIDENKDSIYVGYMYVYRNVEKDIYDFSILENVEDIKIATRHELQHFIQSLIKSITGSLGGLPSKKIRDTNIDPSGIIEKEDTYKEISDPSDSYGRVKHELRDVEFYTNLSDSVEYFNKFKKYIPLQLHTYFALYWIDHISRKQFDEKLHEFIRNYVYKKHDLDPKEYNYHSTADREINSILDNLTYKLLKSSNHRYLFKILKKYQPKKYRKAVSVFMNSIEL